MRQVVLDTETTGLEASQGHCIIEIGCVELVNRRITGRRYHQYIKPDRKIDEGAIEVHGISNEFLADKPSFGDIVEDFLRFIEASELVIHNASFDVGFINAELQRLDSAFTLVEEQCGVLDTLDLARKMHPGQKNNLDALCKRYAIDNTERELHGALLDAQILADVYLAMTGGQTSLLLTAEQDETHKGFNTVRRLRQDRAPLRIIKADSEEQRIHEALLQDIEQASGGRCVWLRTQFDIEEA